MLPKFRILIVPTRFLRGQGLGLVKKEIDALIVDPPRKGCEESFLKSIIGIKKK